MSGNLFSKMFGFNFEFDKPPKVMEEQKQIPIQPVSIAEEQVSEKETQRGGDEIIPEQTPIKHAEELKAVYGHINQLYEFLLPVTKKITLDYIAMKSDMKKLNDRYKAGLELAEQIPYPWYFQSQPDLVKQRDEFYSHEHKSVEDCLDYIKLIEKELNANAERSQAEINRLKAELILVREFDSKAVAMKLNAVMYSISDINHDVDSAVQHSRVAQIRDAVQPMKRRIDDIVKVIGDLIEDLVPNSFKS